MQTGRSRQVLRLVGRLTPLIRVETAWKLPTYILQPISHQDLQVTLPVLVQQNASFAIRAGGHMPSAGFANIDDGVLIDLSHLNTLQYNKDSNVVEVGAGNRWGDLYRYLDQYEVTVVGGRVLDVGVAGLTLGCEFPSSIPCPKPC